MDKKDAVGIDDNDIKIDAKAEKFFENCSQIYQKMATNVRDEHFEDILKIVQNENMILSIDSFRDIFFESLTEIPKKIYEARDLKKTLTIIHLLEERYKQNKTTKWHPHGKSTEEQTISQRISILNRRKNFMFELLNRQQTVLEETVSKVEQNRKRMAELKARRAELNNVLAIKFDELKNVQDEFIKLGLEQLE